MNLQKIRDYISNRLNNISCVRRIYVRLGTPPRIIIDLVPTATSKDVLDIQTALGSLNRELNIDIIKSGNEHITIDGST